MKKIQLQFQFLVALMLLANILPTTSAQAAPLLAYPTDPTANIPWSAGSSGVADIQSAFNNARTVENTQLGTSLPMMTLPSQSEWTALSDGQKALWLVNRERIDRGVLPLEGVESNVTSVAQTYATYLLTNNKWGHTEDGLDPWERLNANPQINACHDFLNIAENLSVMVTSGSSIALPIEKSVYVWMYDDQGSAWGHRHAILWYPYNNNNGSAESEGFLGIGRAHGGPYQGPFSQPWNYAEMIVMNVFDPCASYSAPQVVSIIRANVNPTAAASVNFTVTFNESVTGVDLTDFTLTHSGVTGASISSVSGSATIYTVTVNTGSGSGTIRLDLVDNDSINGATKPLGGSGSGNGNFTSGESYTVDKAPPTVTSSVRISVNPTSAANVSFNVTFSKAVTGVDAVDFTLTQSGVTGASVVSVSGSGAAYTVVVNTGSGDGTIRLDLVDDDSIMDAAFVPLAGAGAGNGDFTSGQSYTIDRSIIIPIFTDVPIEYWARSHIERLANAGVTGGCSTVPLNYCPDNTVTRAQMAIFLLKGIYGSSYVPPAVGSSTGFSDVPVGAFADAWIKQLAAEGITGGCGTGIYCPNNTVTRTQMAIFLLKAKYGTSFSPPPATGVFIDVPVGAFADKWIEKLATEGITGGCGMGIYCPDASVTRAQMAVFLVKAFGLP